MKVKSLKFFLILLLTVTLVHAEDTTTGTEPTTLWYENIPKSILSKYDPLTVTVGWGLSLLMENEFATAAQALQDVYPAMRHGGDNKNEIFILSLIGRVIAYDNLGENNRCMTLLNFLDKNVPANTEKVVQSYNEKIAATALVSRIGTLISLVSSEEVKDRLIQAVCQWLGLSKEYFFPSKHMMMEMHADSVRVVIGEWIDRIDQAAESFSKTMKEVKKIWTVIDALWESLEQVFLIDDIIIDNTQLE